jgi:hypothetical protein
MRKVTSAITSAALGLVMLGLLAIPASAGNTGNGTLTVTVPSSVSFTFTSATTCNFGTVPAGTSSEAPGCLTYDIGANVPWKLQYTTDTKPAGIQFAIRKNEVGTTYTNLAGDVAVPNWRTGSDPGSFSDDFKVTVDAGTSAGAVSQHITYLVAAQ